MTARAVRTVLLGLLATMVSLPLAAEPAAGAGFTAVTIQGDDMERPVRVTPEHPELFEAVLGQVTWMAGRRGQTTAPAEEQLGPKYTVVLLEGRTAKQQYELYPLAEGGPRAHRPRKQPGKDTTAAWFFGRLTMSEALHAAGVPLEVQADPLSGGIGGGQYITDDWEYAPDQSMAVVVEEWQRLFWINFGVLLVITAGLAGVSRLVRPKQQKVRTTRPTYDPRGPGPGQRPPRVPAQPTWDRRPRPSSSYQYPGRPVRR